MNIIKREHNFDDVYLMPQKCVISSRSECDISVQLGRRTFHNPVIAANMKSVVDFGTCSYLAQRNMFYIMHRFIDSASIYTFIKNMNENNMFSSISIGIKEKDREDIKHYQKTGCVPDYITIDVAHAYSDRVIDMVKYIKDELPNTFLIVGNLVNPEAAYEMKRAGADALKLFIAPGCVCTTRVKTGFMRGTVECLQDFREATDLPLIADGGIKEVGHIAKAIAAGATMVMCGSFMAGFDENSGRMVLVDGHKKYIYFGSASWTNKGHDQHVEGTEIIMDYKGKMETHINDIECSLKSSISYAGGRKLSDLYGTPMIAIR